LLLAQKWNNLQFELFPLVDGVVDTGKGEGDVVTEKVKSDATETNSVADKLGEMSVKEKTDESEKSDTSPVKKSESSDKDKNETSPEKETQKS